MNLVCQTDLRRDDVRAAAGRNGLDFVEVIDSPPTLYVYFLGKLPPELAKKKAGLAAYLRIDGGDRITGLKVIDVTPQAGIDAEHDDVLVVRLDQVGDFSAYSLGLNGVGGVDPQYASATFRFRIDCGSDIDCRPACDCQPAALDEPTINYLAKDYASFRQLIFDRMALLVPGWTERHVPDLGVTLVELLAYVGDMLSEYQDAVATEAYLGTARQRISVRRHARLVDFRMHEGCNARAWVHLDVSANLPLDARRIAFVSGANDALGQMPTMFDVGLLRSVQTAVYEYFEPLVADRATAIPLRVAHNSIPFYSWGRRECCLSVGATSATLRDGWITGNDNQPQRLLDIHVGDVLIFEEVLGPKTGVSADADPKRRQAVVITRVEAGEDTLYPVAFGGGEVTQPLPTPVLEITWARADALRFAFCISAIGAAPDCRYLTDVSVARANNILVDHGRTQSPELLGPVPGDVSAACCECEGHPSDVQASVARFRPVLANGPITFSVPLADASLDAASHLVQDPRAAVPIIALADVLAVQWTAQPDLLASGADDRNFVAEIGNDGLAHLRFGDARLGRQPEVGSTLTATYRVGCGAGGNVGAEAISHLVLIDTKLDGVSIGVRNPLPAQGGIDPEPIEEARLFAPAEFRRQIERAITADDYATLAERDARLQRASAQLSWTGSWYEADVAVDPLGSEKARRSLLVGVDESLHPFRRMGHDLRVGAARYVPILLVLRVCARSGYDRGHVKAALLARFGNGLNADGSKGFFHPDGLSFGQDLYLSGIIAAAQAVAGVASVHVDQFHRLFELPNMEIANGVLPLANDEIAQLDNDPDHLERGQLQVIVGGGR
jgi:hypothetical protein